MAKNGRSALGRGLDSLLGGGSYEETNRDRERPIHRIVIDEESVRDSVPIPREVKAPAQREPVPVHPEAPRPRVDSGAEVSVGVHQENSDNEVSIDSIAPNPDQPRTNFKKDELEELSQSIRREGLLQPILVREVSAGSYQIIAGERRWQACKLAGLKTVPVRVKEANDDKALELALIENIQRSDLNPIEEAYGYRRMMERLNLTQSELAQAMSKGRSTVANALRLLELPEEAQQLLFEEKITAGHARAVLSIPTKEGRETLTRKLAKEKLSVREAEAIARLLSGKAATKKDPKPPIPKTYKTVARTLKDVLHTNVKVKSVNGKNKIEIEFKDESDLERLFKELMPSQF